MQFHIFANDTSVQDCFN